LLLLLATLGYLLLLYSTAVTKPNSTSENSALNTVCDVFVFALLAGFRYMLSKLVREKHGHRKSE
jgi:hypothetical protein